MISTRSEKKKTRVENSALQQFMGELTAKCDPLGENLPFSHIPQIPSYCFTVI